MWQITGLHHTKSEACSIDLLPADFSVHFLGTRLLKGREFKIEGIPAKGFTFQQDREACTHSNLITTKALRPWGRGLYFSSRASVLGRLPGRGAMGLR